MPAPTMPPTTIAVGPAATSSGPTKPFHSSRDGLNLGPCESTVRCEARTTRWAGASVKPRARADIACAREQGHPRHRRGPHPDAACRRSNGEAIETSGNAKGRPRGTRPACALRADTRIVGILVPCPESECNAEILPYLFPEVERQHGPPPAQRRVPNEFAEHDLSAAGARQLDKCGGRARHPDARKLKCSRVKRCAPARTREADSECTQTEKFSNETMCAGSNKGDRSVAIFVRGAAPPNTAPTSGVRR